MKKYDNIPGFPGYYISKRGHLWSRYSKGVLSTVWIKKKFYLSSTNGRYKTSIVHETLGKIKMNRYRLVALAYIPNPNGNPEVCHIDSNPTNDYYKNLYWGTYKDNHRDMREAGNFYHSGDDCLYALRKDTRHKDVHLCIHRCHRTGSQRHHE